MLYYFVTKMENGNGGYYYIPNTIGYIILLLIISTLLILISLIRSNKTTKKLQTKQLIFSSLAIALGVVASFIKFYNLPMGGSITLFSMLFICLVGYWFGPKIGIMTSVGYGLLQLFIEPYILSLPQLILDYILAYGALGLSGFMHNKKYGLYSGYILGVLGRYIFSFLSGIIFFANFAPKNFNPVIYALLYNGSYLIPEAAFTLIIITLPPMRYAINNVKKLTVQ
ncbi:energy-coupled thiamine transporter ThiT [Anaerosacchariphilus polymeriproducens]|uniref:Proton-coupled thiamine transporter YuaJ n=1 Tax=Anaerosacchariphilus polymeriproducens TaxID=1812858 RepID=A0A371AWL7_9FIRM|nr:energy-coupled thiamine transporter ThiT [Anaerosacchariphilus polymeriproducens]RDU23974.1 proton-coupled thiamine transporter YuaJ [Anaerosacchariphilus polymeriproducens]